MRLSEFEWPCDKRRAHGPHEVVERTGPQDWELSECPGVLAHPATMIGGRLR